MQYFKLLLISAAAFGLAEAGVVKGLYGKHGPPRSAGQEDPGEPLFLTPLIQAGKLDEARSLSKVGPLDGTTITSYSGYLTVNQSCNSNMFFWFFPALSGNQKAPVLLWLQGGPGGTSMFGLFVENGPFFINASSALNMRDITWAQNYSVVYIDNPVGTGFSFTESDDCYARNQDDVARDLYSALTQFFTLFYEYKSNDFYATGESYAGKYIPAISYKIHQENQKPGAFGINLKGLIVGDGWSDPETMISQYAPYMFNIGLLDENQRDYFASKATTVVQLIQAKKFKEANDIMDSLMDGDLTGYKSWFYNQTGLDFYYNYLMDKEPAEFDYFNSWLIQPFVRKSIHVGNQTFSDGSKVELMLYNDIMDTVKPRVAALLDANYKVLMYSGVLDIIVALPLTEAFLQTVPWSGLEGYKSAPRGIWRITENNVTEVAGYVRIYKNLVQVSVRGGGHILPYDQPLRSIIMIEEFINNFHP